MKAKGMTQKAIANELQVTQQTVSNWLKIQKYKIALNQIPARLMKAKGMTQKAIANELQVTQQTVSNWLKIQNTK